MNTCRKNSLALLPFAPLLVVALTLCSPNIARAEANLKKQVFEDCEAVKSVLPTLGAEEHADFIRYLVRVLEMQDSTAAESLFDPVGNPAAPQPAQLPHVGSQTAPTFDGLLSNSSWRTLKPIREADAKRCAVSLLLDTHSAPVAVLPAIVESSQESNLPADLRAMLADAAWTLTLRMKSETETNFDEESVLRLVRLLHTPSGYLARNILLELHEKSVGHLAKLLLSPDEQRRDDIARVLLEIDDRGTEIGPLLLPLLVSGDDLTRLRAARLLAELPQFYADSFPAIISALGDPSGEVDAQLYEVLQKIVRTNVTLPPKPSTLTETLIHELRKQDSRRRDILEHALSSAARTNPEISNSVRPLLDAEDIDLRGRALRILAEGNSADRATFEAITSRLYEQPLTVRLAAVQALEKTAVSEKDKVQSLLRMLKSVGKEADPAPRRALILATARAIQGFGDAKELAPFVPYLIEAMAFRDGSGAIAQPVRIDELENEATRALVKIGSAAVTDLLKALKNDDALVRGRAARALTQIGGLDSAAAKTVLNQLKDRDPLVRSEVEQGLPRIARTIVPDLERSLTSTDITMQVGAAKTLAALHRSGPAIESALQNAVVRLSCPERPALVRLVLEVNPQVSRNWLQETLVNCLLRDGGDKEPILQALLAVAPLDENSSRQVLAILGNKMVGRTIRLRVAEESKKLGLRGPNLTNAVLELLHDSDRAIKARVLRILGNLGPAAISAADEIKAIAEDSGEERTIRVRAVTALAAIDPAAFDYKKFLAEDLGTERSIWTETAIMEMSPEYAVPLLVDLLQSVKEEKRDAVISSLGKFGTNAATATDELLPLLKDNDADVRYLTLDALLQINPALPEVLPSLRAELIGENSNRLQDNKYSSVVVPLLDSIIADPHSFAEKRRAERLRARLV